MQIADLDAMLGKIIGQILGHALRERGDQHAFVTLDAELDLGQ